MLAQKCCNSLKFHPGWVLRRSFPLLVSVVLEDSNERWENFLPVFVSLALSLIESY